jgi:hypothetical protein
MLSAGRVSALRVLSALIVSPGLMKDLCRLARQTRLAATRLAAALEQVLFYTSEPGKTSPIMDTECPSG